MDVKIYTKIYIIMDTAKILAEIRMEKLNEKLEKEYNEIMEKVESNDDKDQILAELKTRYNIRY